MAPQQPLINVHDIYRATAPEVGTSASPTLTPDEILQLSDALPGVVMQTPANHKKQRAAIRIKNIFASSRLSDQNAMLPAEVASTDVAAETTSDEDWVATAVRQAIEIKEIAPAVYDRISGTSVGKAATDMLRKYGVKIPEQTQSPTAIPEDIFKPAKKSAPKPSVGPASAPNIIARKTSLEKLEGMKRQIGMIANLIPGYRGTKIIAVGVGALATLAAAVVLPFKVMEGISYDVNVSTCRENALICEGLKAIDGVIQGGLNIVDEVIPGGKK